MSILWKSPLNQKKQSSPTAVEPFMVEVELLRTSRFHDLLLQKYAFFNFAQRYLIGRNVDRSFEVNEAVLQEFREFLDTQGISPTEIQTPREPDWIKTNEIFYSQFDQEECMQTHAETDPEVLASLNLLARAKRLAETANNPGRTRTCDPLLRRQ
jgi:carboxyl-terminal processing protease